MEKADVSAKMPQTNAQPNAFSSSIVANNYLSEQHKSPRIAWKNAKPFKRARPTAKPLDRPNRQAASQ